MEAETLRYLMPDTLGLKSLALKIILGEQVF